MTANQKHRAALRDAKRIVIKAGSKVLVQQSGRPDKRRLKLLVDEMTTLRKQQCDIAFVSSGAVGAGLEVLGMKTRPAEIQDLQMAAAVGQLRLMSLYDDLFSAHDCTIAQVLLTHDVLKDRVRHLNARNTLMNLIANRIIPVINENDTISTAEIKFGDNDMLAALVSILVDADALILLSSTDGFREPTTNGRSRRVSCIEEVDEDVLGHVNDQSDHLSTGGMASKLSSAQMAAHNGIPVIIANGRKTGVLTRILEGKDEGTLLLPKAVNMSKRKRWIAFFNHAEGSLEVDPGAVKALQDGKSLLPVGIQNVTGNFKIGAMVNILGPDGQLIARGLVEDTSETITRTKGKKADNGDHNEVIHRDNMVLL